MTTDKTDSKKMRQCTSRRIDEHNILWIPIQSVNPHLICGLCQGYLYEACTITECMHSFCKNCIVKHLDRSLNCPMCAILIHPTDPFVHIRFDGLLQDIVYALLPHVEKDELMKEKAFYEKHNKEIKKNQIQVTAKVHPPVHQTQTRHIAHVPQKHSFIPPISLRLKCLEPRDNFHRLTMDRKGNHVRQTSHKEYIRVTGGATIHTLSLFLKKKLQIGDTQKVALYCPSRSGYVCLNNSHTLKAVKDLYCHDREVLDLNYDVGQW